MKNIFIFLTLILVSLNMNAQEKFTADRDKTTLSWLGEKVMGQHTGTVKLLSGWINWQNNMITSGEFLIDMKTIKDDENSARLEGHLKSDDFFGVDKFPVSKLVITGSESFEKGTAVVKGNLTIKETTLPVEFKATIQKSEEGIWFYSNIIVDRSKYNVRYGSGSFFSNLGNNLIYDEFKVKVNLLVKK
ncbi:MAG: YceI family protein [Bacteroidales bacterium]|nr:YceI family protein [Bacteroidales bacterium]